MNYSTISSNKPYLLTFSSNMMQVNVTLLTFIYAGINNSLCLFGGLTMYDVINSTYKETFSSCKSHVYDTKSFYSTNSSLLFVLYMYKYYSLIHVTFSVSSTNCEPIVIDICEYYMYYRLTGTFNSKSSFLGTVSVSYNKGEITFSAKEGACFIMQFTQTRKLSRTFSIQTEQNIGVCTRYC